MPHFGLMNSGELGSERAALQRARLHLRGGKRRLRQGKISAGLVTLYDALECALEWYAASPGRRARASLGEPVPRESPVLFSLLTAAGILDGSFDFDSFEALAEKALHDDLASYDWRPLVEGLEKVMTALGVMPFSEAELPAEDPSTF